MNDISIWFNDLADQGSEDILLRMRAIKRRLDRQKADAALMSMHKAIRDQERDQLIAAIADALGIDRDEYPNFFETIE